VRRELSPASRLPLFALAAVAAAAVLALLVLLDPSAHARRAHGPARAVPSPVAIGGSPSPAASPTPAPTGAVRVGARFLRLYARLQTEPLGGRAARQLRLLTSLALAHTLLAQPPQPAGGAHARGVVARIRVERLSWSAVLLHAAVRHGGALLRVRCLVQRDQGRWTATALMAAA
jgi:hypothetical protein